MNNIDKLIEKHLKGHVSMDSVEEEDIKKIAQEYAREVVKYTLEQAVIETFQIDKKNPRGATKESILSLESQIIKDLRL
jgi:hypothetical protein